MQRSMRPPWRAARNLRRAADHELMPLVAAADADAFQEVYDRHADAAFSLAYRMCGRRSTAEEVVQEGFLSLWRSAAAYCQERGSVRTWVLRIVHNRAVDALRRGALRDGALQHDDGIAERIASPERTDEQAEARDRRGSIRDALRELPREQARVIELAYFGGFTHTEIAEMLHAPVGTVKGRMRLGLSKLRVTLADEIPAEPEEVRGL